MLLKEVRYEGINKKLLFKVLIEEDSLIISTKCRESKEPVLVDLETIIKPYVDDKTIKQIRVAFRTIYHNVIREENKAS